MFDDFIKKAETLRKNNEPFATAVVVRREAPSSGKAGDKAIINQYGELFGWVGGGCTRSIILNEAEAAIREGKSRFIRVSPETDLPEQEGVKAYKMTCHSGGSVDVFIEPVLPKPHLVVLGKSAIAKSLVRLGKAMDYWVTAMAPGARIDTFEKVDRLHTQWDFSSLQKGQPAFIVVATQGEQDEQALEKALAKDWPYVAFISSRKKRDRILQYLKGTGIPEDRLAELRSPAGLDIDAKLPEEVAISILAEMIKVLRSTSFSFRAIDQQSGQTVQKEKPYINPVCGIPVDKATAKHVLEYEGESVYFCCDGCKLKFESNPAQYMVVQD